MNNLMLPITPTALSGLTVLDLSRVLAGPYCAQMLGDFGAQVIKVERPELGDDTRHWGPPFTHNGESAYFFCANRNKKSITLDLKSDGGRAILEDLVQKADILVENFKVGMLDGLGIGYKELSQINPGLIHCSITGYGYTGPYSERPGYDIAIEAQGGIMSITGEADGEPSKVGVAIVDVTTGLHAVIAILAALRHREATGEGQHIDVSLFDTQLSWLINIASSYLVSGQKPQRFGNGHAAIVPYQTFPTADSLLMLAVGNDGQFRRLCHALKHPEWAHDERFKTNVARVHNRSVLIPLLEDIFLQQTAAAWYELLVAADVTCSPVNDIPTALTDPQTEARQMVQYINHPITGSIPQLGPVAKMSATSPAITLPPPLLSEHTDQVLKEYLGYSEEKLVQLRQDGII